MEQPDLFAASMLPSGMQYQTDFISPEEEATLLAAIGELPLSEAKYLQYTARRRTINFGAGYDFSHQRTTAAPSLPAAFEFLRERAAQWAGLKPHQLIQALVAEYQIGTPLGWHRDVPDYEVVVGISLGASARMRMRPYPWSPERKREIIAIELAPRSAYILRDAARWAWQHQIPPTKAHRFSITFRSGRAREHG